MKDILKTWKRQGYRLTLYYLGGERLGYRFTDQGKVVFTGTDFRPSPRYAIDSLNTVYALLGFLSLKEGDTDKEYFAKYTLGQLAWANSARAERLSSFVNEFEERGRK